MNNIWFELRKKGQLWGVKCKLEIFYSTGGLSLQNYLCYEIEIFFKHW